MGVSPQLHESGQSWPVVTTVQSESCSHAVLKLDALTSTHVVVLPELPPVFPPPLVLPLPVLTPPLPELVLPPLDPLLSPPPPLPPGSPTVFPPHAARPRTTSTTGMRERNDMSMRRLIQATCRGGSKEIPPLAGLSLHSHGTLEGLALAQRDMPIASCIASCAIAFAPLTLPLHPKGGFPMSVQGKIVWHDLMTNDVEKARRFYSELFAWRIKDEGGWSFIYANDSDKHFGTVMSLPTPHMPPHWIPYFAVDNLDAAMTAITAAGGKLHTAKMNAGTTGTFAIAADPQGASFTAWQYAAGHEEKESEAQPKAGHFCWDELLTSDTAAAQAFYTKVFGYGTDKMTMPGMDYSIFLRQAKKADGKPWQAAGMMKLPQGVPHPFWESYVVVDNCDASMEKAKRLGAALPMPAMDIPSVGRFTTILDPSMAALGILQPAG
jgi:predicted enzyme related to lactoylglutathione lyase